MAPLQTPRLTLTFFNPTVTAHYGLLLSLYNSPFTQKGSGDHNLHTHADIDVKCAGIAASPSIYHGQVPPPQYPYHLIHLKTTGAFIGVVSLAHRAQPRFPDLGYALVAAEFEGKGYVNEAGREVLRFWREEVGVREVWVGTSRENAKSGRVALKLGFVEGGPVTALMPGGQKKVLSAYVMKGMDPFPEGYLITL